MEGAFMRFSMPILLSALLMVSACNRNEPRTTAAAPEDRTDATDRMKKERDDYVKVMQSRLAEFDQKVDGLDKRAAAMTGTVKTSFKEAIDRLREQRKAVASQLDDLKRVSVESWTTMRSEVDSAFAKLERSYNEVSEMHEKTPVTPTSPKSNPTNPTH
jgi:hypothetical protein